MDPVDLDSIVAKTWYASDDVWEEYLKHFPAASQWRTKTFKHYEYCCVIFGKDSATGEGACTAADVLEEVQAAMELSSSDSSKVEEVPKSTGSKRSSGSAMTDVSSASKKKKSLDSHVGESIVKAVQILGKEISKAQARLSNVLIGDKDGRQEVLAAMEEVKSLTKSIYATKIMSAPELMDALLALQLPFCLQWLQKMLPGTI